MYGLEAINMHNGWAMAGVGAITVFIGLTVLATVISQLHKVLEFFNASAARARRSLAATPAAAAPEPKDTAPAEIQIPTEINQVAAMYQNAAQGLGSHFELKDLHQIARKMDFPHPHITISALRQEDKLGSEEDGLFFWKL